MCDHQVKVAKFDQVPGSFLFIPQGWMVAETCGVGDAVGLVKIYMLSWGSSSKSMKAVVELMKNGGLDVAKMETIVSKMDDAQS